jgi:hypothetical protein
MDQSLEEQNSSLLAAALDGHSITDQEGEIAEDTAFEDTATQEENTETDTATSDKTAEDETTPSPQDVDESDETNLAVDDSGKRYIPEKRFKKTYAEKKQLERENEALKALVTSTVPAGTNVQPTPTSTSSNPDLDRLELKMVFKEYPQFNPNSDDYSPEIDKLAGNLRRANNSLSVTEAAEEAMKMVKSFTSNQVQVAREARTVKALQSDQGITSRVTNRQPSQVDFDSLTLEQKEQYLKDNGQW